MGLDNIWATNIYNLELKVNQLKELKETVLKDNRYSDLSSFRGNAFAEVTDYFLRDEDFFYEIRYSDSLAHLCSTVKTQLKREWEVESPDLIDFFERWGGDVSELLEWLEYIKEYSKLGFWLVPSY